MEADETTIYTLVRVAASNAKESRILLVSEPTEHPSNNNKKFFFLGSKGEKKMREGETVLTTSFFSFLLLARGNYF